MSGHPPTFAGTPCHRWANAGRAAGFTLIELMVTLAISAVLMVLAMPSYRSWVQGAKIKTAAESVLTALTRARAEAVRRNAPVSLSIQPLPGAGAVWSISAQDSNLTGTLAADAAHATMSDAATGTAGNGVPVNVLASTNVSTAGSDSAGTPPITVTFTGLGRVSSATSTRRIDFVSALPDVDFHYAILLSPGGAPRMCNPALTRAQSVQGCL